MSETKFTPAPWSMSRHAIYGPTAGGPSKEEPLAIVSYWSPDCPVEDNGHPNAHLIKVAPDLYVALEALLREIKQPHGEGWEVEPLYLQALAVLAKARGEVAS